MTISIAPPPKLQFFDKTVTPIVPLSGGKLYTYDAGTSTPKATYTDSTGGTANANPVILDSNGEASVWLNGLYKINLTNSAGTQVSGYPVDNVSSSPAVSTAFSEWLALAHTWTYVTATSFSVPGDVTLTYQVGRRVKCTVTAGTVYGIITVSTYASSITTVTVVNDSGSLDNGLSDVKVGVLTHTNPSMPKSTYDVMKGTAGGTVDAMTVTFSPAPIALANGIECLIEMAGANTSTTPALNANALGAKTIVKDNNIPLVPGDIPGANFWAHFVFDASLDKWVMLNPAYSSYARIPYAVSGGSADAYTVAFTPPFTAYYAGMTIYVLISAANLTTTPAVFVDGMASKTIQRKNSVAVYIGDMPINYIAHFVYNGSSFDLLNPYKPLLMAGMVAGSAIYASGGVATGTTTIPVDDTIPQNTEGDEYLSVSYTPTNVNNTLVVEVLCSANSSTVAPMAIALFRDSTANALAAQVVQVVTTDDSFPLALKHEVTAGSLAATTFKIRIGSAGAGTTTFNGSGGARLFGGVMNSYIKVTEVVV